MDGLLVVDKPAGPSSHDVVARVRRALRESRIGHTGTLDPAATGVLPLVVGRATRLARFLSGATKSYDALVRLGTSTNTYDAAGEVVGPVFEGPWPGLEAIDRALDAFRGPFAQRPPAYSAKKIGGQPSYATARRADRQREADGIGSAAVQLEPVRVETTAVDVVRVTGPDVELRVDCSAGFYVRSLAHDLGQALGTGAHLAALRRTRSGEWRLADAVPLAELEQAESACETAEARMVPLAAMLPGVPALTLSEIGIRHATHGRELTPLDFERPAAAASPANRVEPVYRLVTPDGALVALGRPGSSPGALHPFVVLV